MNVNVFTDFFSIRQFRGFKQLSFSALTPIAPNLDVFKKSAVEAFPIAIVGFAVAFSVAKVYAIKHDYTIDGNQVSY